MPIFTVQRKPQKEKEFTAYSRKEKSLGQLSKNFLEIFGKIEEKEVSLDLVTNALGVERRRIYDIINILESIEAVYRMGKNHYYWYGLSAIKKSINSHEKKISENGLDFKDLQIAKSKEKSLGFLAVGFIRLFLGWKSIITLDQAAEKLTHSSELHKLKTKIRRLYDIANVFLALGVIKKAYLSNRKPAFEWLGVVGLENMMKKMNIQVIKRNSKEDSSSNWHFPCTL